MHRLLMLLAIFAALSVGLVPVADTRAKVEAAVAGAAAGRHHAADSGCDRHPGDCEDQAAKPHPGHCPACTALAPLLVLAIRPAPPATPSPAVQPRLLAGVPPVDLPPPRLLRA